MAQVNVRNRKRSDGSNNWEYRFEGASINGKRKQISKSGFKTKREALDAGVKALAEYNRSGIKFEPSEMSFADYLDYWLKNYCEKNLSDNTTAGYNNVIQNHIKPKLGMYKLNTISFTILQEFLNDLNAENKYSPKYITTFKKVLTGSLKYASISARFINHNPAIGLTIPNQSKDDVEEYTILSKEDVEVILNRFQGKPEQYYAILIAYNTGLRISEVYGLTWDKIDLENNTITVDRIIKHFDYENRKDKINNGIHGKLLTRWLLGDCKTKSSNRVIKFGNSLHDALVQLKAEQEDNKKMYGDYYTRIYLRDELSRNNKPIKRLIQVTEYMPDLEEADFVLKKFNGETTGTHTIKYVSKVIREELGIDFCFHSLRHTHATMLIESGVPINQVSKRLGHSSSRITWDIYIGASSELDESAANIFEEKNAIKSTN